MDLATQLKLMRLHRDHTRSLDVTPKEPFWLGLGYDYNMEYPSMEGDDTEYFQRVEKILKAKEIVSKHRPGGHDHDQSTHGRRGNQIGDAISDYLDGDESDLRRYVKMVALHAEMSGRETMHTAILRHGTLWKGPTPERNAELIEEYDVQVGQAKECFMNATHAATGNGWKDSDLTYVEGYAVTSLGIPIHHAWLVTPDDEVIDPTWHSQTTPGVDRPLDPGLEYYGIPVSHSYLRQRAIDTEVYGIWQGIGEPPDPEEF